MQISDIIDEKSIFLNVNAQNKKQLLQFIAEKTGNALKADSKNIFDALLERENLGSTGFGGGSAVPHTRLSNLSKVYGMFIRLKNSIDFSAVDGKPINVIFALISPEDKGADHLNALATISRLLKNEVAIEKLQQAKDNSETYAILTEE